MRMSAHVGGAPSGISSKVPPCVIEQSESVLRVTTTLNTLGYLLALEYPSSESIPSVKATRHLHSSASDLPLRKGSDSSAPARVLR